MSSKDHDKILAIFGVLEYGDITDLKDGRDLKVTHIKPVKEGEYAQNMILALPDRTPATTEQAVAELIVKMPTVQSILTEPTMDEMTLLLRKFSENGGKKVDLKAPTLTAPSNVVNAGPAIVQQPVNGIAVQQSTTVPAASAAPAGGDVNATFAQYFKK
jgi:ABC-type branched-subunit amino acid transport system substrate-binding protein